MLVQVHDHPLVGVHSTVHIPRQGRQHGPGERVPSRQRSVERRRTDRDPDQFRRQLELALQIGPRHGYRIEGDQIFINADLQVPPQHPGGEWSLELWATEQPYREGALAGLKIAEIAVDLPTPIATYLHQVDAWTTARTPLHGRTYAMVLALVRPGADGQMIVGAFANYAEPQTFIAPHFADHVGHRRQGNEVLLEAASVVNPRIEGNLSGTLSLELWAFPEAGSSSDGTSDGTSDGMRLAACEIGCVAGQNRLSGIERQVAFTEPPVGRHRLALRLCEWTVAHGYVARDSRDLASVYERLASVPAVTPPAATTSLATDVAAAPAPASGLVSIQTASVDELAGVKGLNLKLAKEIIKARPFASLADLVRVRGLGEKSVARLKGLLTI